MLNCDPICPARSNQHERHNKQLDEVNTAYKSLDLTIWLGDTHSSPVMTYTWVPELRLFALCAWYVIFAFQLSGSPHLHILVSKWISDGVSQSSLRSTQKPDSVVFQGSSRYLSINQFLGNKIPTLLWNI